MLKSTDRNLHREAIDELINRMYSIVSNSESSKCLVVDLGNKWTNFVAATYDNKLSDDVIALYKTIDEQLEKLLKSIEKDPNCTWLNIHFAILYSAFDKYVETGKTESIAYNLERDLKNAFNLTDYLSELKEKENRCNLRLNDLLESLSNVNSEGEKRNLNVAINECKLELKNIYSAIDNASKSYLITSKDLALDPTIIQKINEYVLDIRDSILEKEAASKAAENSIDEIYHSVISDDDFIMKDLESCSTNEAKPLTQNRDDNADVMAKLDTIINNQEVILNNQGVTTNKMDQVLEKIDLIGININSSNEDIKKFIETSNKLTFDKLIEEFKKLDVNSLGKQIASLIRASEDNKLEDATQEQIIDADSAILASEVALAEKMPCLKEFVTNILNQGHELPNLTAACANVRGLIDAYCRFNFGIQLNTNQRPENYEYDNILYYNYQGKCVGPSTKKDDGTYSNVAYFCHCFKNQIVAKKIKNYWNSCNKVIHVSSELFDDMDKWAELAIEAATYLNDELKIDFSSIDFIGGAKKLIKQEEEWKKQLEVEINYFNSLNDSKKAQQKQNDLENLNLRVEALQKFLDSRKDINE